MNKLILIIMLLIVTFSGCSSNNNVGFEEIQDTPISDGKNLIDKEFRVGNEVYGIFDDGNLYIKDSNNNWVFFLEYYDKKTFEKFYQPINKEIYLVVPDSGEKILTKKKIIENFEGKAHIKDLIYRDMEEFVVRNWGRITLLSPKADSVAKYNDQFRCILKEECDFLDNRVDVVNNFSYSGNNSIKFLAVKPNGNEVSKASISSTELMYFAKGEDLWFSGMFYIEEGMPVTIADFENQHFYMSPGPRLIFSGNYLAVELKAGEKPMYKQNQGEEISFPKKQWVNVKAYFRFSEKEDGIIQVWQDGVKIIDTLGVNLPTSNSIQNILEFGITATREKTIMYMDDIIISNKKEDVFN